MRVMVNSGTHKFELFQKIYARIARKEMDLHQDPFLPANFAIERRRDDLYDLTTRRKVSPDPNVQLREF
jgi:hypothetical protein